MNESVECINGMPKLIGRVARCFQALARVCLRTPQIRSVHAVTILGTKPIQRPCADEFRHWHKQAIRYGFIVLVFFPAAITAYCNEKTGVILNGTCEYIVRPENMSPSYSAHYSFEVSLLGSSWIVTYEDISALTNSNVLNVRGVASCDGTNIYLVQYQNEIAVKKAWGSRYESIKNELPVAQAEIYPGSYPPPNPSILQQLWFAFASSTTFTGSSGKAKPPAFVDLAIFYSAEFECAYFWSNSVTTRQITLKSDGRIPGRDIATGQMKYLKRSPYTSGVGVWSEVTSIAGVFVGRKFEYAEFAPLAASQNSKDLLKTWAFKCTLTSVRTGAIDQIPTKLPEGRILMTDRRFLASGYSKINYISVTGWIPAENEYVTSQLSNRPLLSLEDEFAHALGSRPAPRTKPVRYVIWAALALPLCLLLAKGLFDKLKNKKKD